MYVPRNSWKRIVDVDFTEYPTQNLSPAGNYTILGNSWTSENTAAASAITFTNGTGLVITPNAGASLYGDDARTSPLVRTNLTNFVGDLAFGQIKAYRFLYRVTLANANEDFEFAKCGVERATTPARFHSVVGRGFNTSDIVIEGQISTSATSSRENVTSSDDVIGFIWKPHWNFDFIRGGTWNGKWPREFEQVTALTSSLGANYMRDIGDPVAADVHPRLVFTAQPTGSATTFTATWTHFAIDRLVQ